MSNSYRNLNPDKALIWRIVHRDNLSWILSHGLHCQTASVQAPKYIPIGNTELIDKRAHREVPIPPGGTLADYVPFYFTPFSPMMYNIHTGRGGVIKRNNEDICILVSSIPKVQAIKVPFLFTDRHAYLPFARYFNDSASLTELDWPSLQARDFKRSLDDPEKIERYQAEALVHQTLPVSGLLGVICYTNAVKCAIDVLIEEKGIALDVRFIPGWYF